MKLNNKGWGLGVFLGFVAMLLLCIAVAGINAYKMGLSTNSPTHYFEPEISSTPAPTPTPTSDTFNEYKNLEAEALEAATNYKNNLYPSLAGDAKLIISLRNLVEENYLSSSQKCSGYVEVQNQNQNLEYRVFLNCPDYTTEGYNSELDRRD